MGEIRWESVPVEALVAVLRAMPPEAAAPLALARLGGAGSSLELARFVADLAASVPAVAASVSRLASTPYGAVAAAELAQNASDGASAERNWAFAAQALPDSDRPEAELALARWLLPRDKAAAAACLRRAARLSRDAGFWQKAGQFLQRLDLSVDPAIRRRAKVSLVSSAATQLFAPMLKLALFREGVAVEILEAPIGNHRQEAFFADSELHRFAPDFVILSLEAADFGVPALAASAPEESDRVARELRELSAALRGNTSRTVLCDLLPLPADDSAGHLGGVHPSCRAAVISEASRAFRLCPGSGVIPVDIPALQAECGSALWRDAKLWSTARQRPAPSAMPTLASHYASVIAAALGLSRKVLVLDLDNTLWRGVIGEDGLGGIRVGPPDPEGEAHSALQRHALELRERGVLLAVCSKNNDADARLPFERHDGMTLKLEDIAAFHANWTDKPANLRAIAKSLNLGVDSLVFVDDNPAERRLVERELPEVAVVPYAGDAFGFVRSLAEGRHFQSLALSAEDLARQAQYKANAEREEVLRTGGGDMGAFLLDLRMEVFHGAFSPLTFDRVAQLFGKTNQFNLTSVRHNREFVESLAADSAVWTRWFRLADRFGDNGIVGQVVIRETDPGVWEFDSFLMSCRVIGRKMEDYMAWLAAASLRARGARELRGVYRPTAKNSMVADLYPRLGYEEISRTETEVRYSLNLTSNLPEKPDYFIEREV